MEEEAPSGIFGDEGIWHFEEYGTYGYKKTTVVW